MSYRRKLLVTFALTVCCSVAAIAIIVTAATRRAFQRVNREQTQALIAQFQREFNRQGEEVAARVSRIAGSEAALRMAVAVARIGPDYGAYLTEAKSVAESQPLQFLEFVDAQGTILSSAQSPAKFGYKDESVNLASAAHAGPFLKKEDLPNESVLGVFSARVVEAGEKPMYVLGGRQIDRDFLNSLELPAGMRAWLYQFRSPEFSAHDFVSAATGVAYDKLAPLILQARQQGSEVSQTIHWSANPEDDETLHVLPLRGQNNQLLAALLVGSAQRPYIELERRIRSVALLVGGTGILLTVLLSSWTAARLTRPVAQLATAARQVAAGNWDTRVELTSNDEWGELADAFNRMTSELLDQKDRLVQAERVAAWRELARRLAHELKNPLFPLQLTVENLLRAREQSPEMFEEIFRESTSALLAEIANLKTITGRFSEFSQMPQPRFQAVELNDLVRGVGRLFEAQLKTRSKLILCHLELDENLPLIAADPDLLHKAVSNLVLNAIDAMSEGGELTIRTSRTSERVLLEVRDTGIGLTREECDRLFTPYYTSKQHGTGLGLAIVQSIVSDHRGRITVASASPHGTSFSIELPLNLEKLSGLAQTQSGTSRL